MITRMRHTLRRYLGPQLSEWSILPPLPPALLLPPPRKSAWSSSTSADTYRDRIPGLVVLITILPVEDFSASLSRGPAPPLPAAELPEDEDEDEDEDASMCA